MRCCCYETKNEFIYCVEGAEGKTYEKLQADPNWTKTDDEKFVKKYSMDTVWDDAWYRITEYKEAIINNFVRLGQSWIEGII